jgi:hypothetical protein
MIQPLTASLTLQSDTVCDSFARVAERLSLLVELSLFAIASRLSCLL